MARLPMTKRRVERLRVPLPRLLSLSITAKIRGAGRRLPTPTSRSCRAFHSPTTWRPLTELTDATRSPFGPATRAGSES